MSDSLPDYLKEDLDNVLEEESGEPTAEDVGWIDTGTETGAAVNYAHAVVHEGRNPETLAQFIERTETPVRRRQREREAAQHHWDDVLTGGKAAVFRLARAFQRRGMSAKAAFVAAQGRDRHRET